MSENGGESWRLSKDLPVLQPSGIAFFGAAEPAYVVVPSNQRDALLLKLSPAGAVVAGTFFGGAHEDSVTDLAIDRNGDVVVSGVTGSPDLPVPAGSVQPTKGGAHDAFLAIIASDASRVLHATYFGGSGSEMTPYTGVDANGSIYLAGGTNSEDLPVRKPLQPLPAAASTGDAFIAKLSPSLSSLEYSTRIGGRREETVAALAVARSGAVALAGATSSDDFPVVNNVGDCRKLSGDTDEDAFVAWLQPDGTALTLSSCLGGQAQDQATAAAFLPDSSLALAAWTDSPDFFGTVRPIESRDSFVMRLVAGTPEPALSAQGVVNAASFEPGAVAPGSIATLLGSNLAEATAAAITMPLPTELAGVRVSVDGLAAPLFYVSPGQINLQMPWALQGRSTAVLRVHRGSATLERTVAVARATPGIFVAADGFPAILRASDYALVNVENQTARGDYILVYATGLGELDRPAEAGEPAGLPAPTLVQFPIVRIGGQAVEVAWAGLAPGFAGLYQVNVRVPESIQSGRLTLEMEAQGALSNRVSLLVR
ncbi:MAG: hypothetical protein WD696_14725 [Bryobacteraceae bacterium]